VSGGERVGGQRSAATAAAVVLAVVVLLAIAYAPLFILVRGVNPRVFGLPGGTAVGSLAFAVMGALIARRSARNPVGWILLAVGAALMVVSDAQLYSLLVYRAGYSRLPLGPFAAWLGSTLWGPTLALIPIGLLLFPDGRLPSALWRRGLVACVVMAALFTTALVAFTASTVLAGPVSVGLDGQLSVLSATKPAGGLETAFLASFPLLAASLAVGAAGLIRNTIRSEGERRQQMKWFMYAASLSTVGVATYVLMQLALGVSTATQVASAIAVVALASLPVGAAIAVFKYRLYDIDVVINHTIVYSALAVFITAVYVGMAVGIGALVGGGGKPNLALSILATAIVAVGFQPVRERVQRVANRLVYGNRATPYEVLAEFSERVAQSYAADDVMPRMARVLAEGTGAQRARVWLCSGDIWRNAAVWPPEAGTALPVQVANGTLPPIDGADRVVDVRHQGVLLGALSITKRAGEVLTPVEENLLADLAGQAGLVLKNVGLTGDLNARLEELRASRQRLVTAQDAERRRLERNLHDGAQQHLVAIKVKLGLAEMLASRDPEKARATIEQLKGDADEALETLRDLARGIYPPLLAEKGLGAALESQARKATLPVTVTVENLHRYSQDVEAAVYFSVLEALQNVQKYADAAQVTVRLRDEDRTLRFEVTDDGRGFDVASTGMGSGLTNMTDRLDALDGEVRITSAPGHGTHVSGSLPVVAVGVAA
jgi:signal transduction histidine kinase